MSKNTNIELGNLEIYKKIVEHMNESLWIGDSNNNTIFTNNIFCEITGYKLEEIIGESYCKFWSDDSINIIKKISQKSNTDKIKYEANIKTKNDDIIPVLCSGTKTENGGIVLMISDLRELNSLKQAEKKLIKLNKTKDEFISIVGHELRTPLTSIRGYLSMVLDGDMGKINKNVKNALEHSYKSSIRLIELVNDVLSIGKIESGKIDYNIGYYKITDIINSVYDEMIIETKNKGQKFYIDFDQNLRDFKIKVDKNKLKQVFINLISNSIKFTKTGGEITLKISKIKDNIRFEVIDNGIGIPKEKIGILFNKFSQIESSMQRENTSGLGLGLTICENFIEKFGSKINVKSELGKGSNFYFDLKLI